MLSDAQPAPLYAAVLFAPGLCLKLHLCPFMHVLTMDSKSTVTSFFSIKYEHHHRIAKLMPDLIFHSFK